LPEGARIQSVAAKSHEDRKGPIMNKLRTTLAVAVISVLATNAQAANIVETAQKAGTFKTLIAAAKAAGLAGALSSGRHLAVFAPTDAAFAKLPKGTVASLLKP
jgi:uncharacterized surface protein with fasciclin (FAS1) repeats